MDIGIIAAIASTLAVIGSGVACFVRWGLPSIRKWSRRADAIFGIAADPATGQEHIPGVLERMDAQDVVLEAIKHEVQTNTGTSLKDAVKNIERRLDLHLVRPAPDQSTTININPPEQPTQ